TVTLHVDGLPADEIKEALVRPERPLFIGRKTCLPAAPLLLDRIEAASLPDALERAPLADRVVEEVDGDTARCRSWWPVEPGAEEGDLAKPVTDRRDWANQIHVGERWIAEGTLEVDVTEETDE
ncbi:MAG: type I-E CRISPR-associated protein Cas5/CasD, partial [Bradymonadaceae bacterium]